MKIISNQRKKLTLLLILAVVLASLRLGATRNFAQEATRLRPSPLPVQSQAHTQAFVDFDGDQLLDRAELTSNGFHKHIHLSSHYRWVANLHFFTESQQTGSLYAEDIDHDGDNDLIWVSDRQPTQSALWLNKGIGEFSRVDDISAYTIDIKRLISVEDHSGIFSLLDDEQSTAIENGVDSNIRRNDGCLLYALNISLPSFGFACAAELSPCISRYPKRGPPSVIS